MSSKEIIGHCPYCNKLLFKKGYIQTSENTKVCRITNCHHCLGEIEECWGVAYTVKPHEQGLSADKKVWINENKTQTR